MEADCCFYVRENALRYRAARDMGTQQAEDFRRRVPPDLVIEVEVTNRDYRKPERWAELGVTELWKIDGPEGQSLPDVTVIDLKAKGGPCGRSESLLFPGLDTGTLAKAVNFAERGRFEQMEETLRAVLSPAPDEEEEDSGFDM